MKKGCIITLIVVVALLVIGGFITVKYLGPKIMSGANSAVIFAVDTAVTGYIEEFGEAPQGDHEKVVEVLRGNNPKEITFLGSEMDGQVVDGKLVDTWRNPLKMTREDGTIRFTSAGPNGNHGDGDDISGAAIQNLIDTLEEKAKAKAKAEAATEAKAEPRAAE